MVATFAPSGLIEGLFTFVQRDIFELTGSPVGVPVRALALTFGKKGRSPPGNPLPASASRPV